MANEITIDNRLMGYIALFESVTHENLRECMETEDIVLFVVNEKKMGNIFKRNPNVVSVLKDRINKHIIMAEASRDLLTMTRNILFRYGVREIHINWKEGQTDIQVSVAPEEIGRVIGKEGRNIKLFREVLARYFPVHSLSVKQ